MSGSEFQLTINTRVYCTTLLVFVIAFVIIHCSFNYYTHEIESMPWLLQQLFDLDEENNIPTWFSSFLLANSAFVLYIHALVVPGNFKIYWFILAGGFLVLSLDEVAGIHETVNTAIDINWAIPAGILITIVGLAYIPFLLSLDRRLAGLFILSGAIYVSGVIVVELLSEDMEEDTLAYGFATGLEEGLEMLGAWLFLRVNLKELQRENHVRIKVSAT